MSRQAALRRRLRLLRQAPTPNVIILEVEREGQKDFLDQLDRLAQVCDAGTKVLVVGHVNDVLLYRDLVRRGVSDYLIAPDQPDRRRPRHLRALHQSRRRAGGPDRGRRRRQGGAWVPRPWRITWPGPSRVIWIPRQWSPISTSPSEQRVWIFNQDPPQGIAEAIFAPDRLDANVVDRLMSKCSEKLSLLAAPAMLERTCDLTETAFDQLFDLLRASVPCIVLDIPHVWCAWSRRTLLAADDIVVVAAPELASLRNTKNIVDLLRQEPSQRPSTACCCSTRVGIPKRPENRHGRLRQGDRSGSHCGDAFRRQPVRDGCQ